MKRLSFILLVGIIVVGGYLGYQYIAVQSMFDEGHTAYLAGDCATAIVEFSSLVEQSPLDLGGFIPRAEDELIECQTTLYDTAHTAYLAGDCETAMPVYTQLIDQSVDTNSTVQAAEVEWDECESFQNIEGAFPASALSRYFDFITYRFPDSGLGEIARERMLMLFAEMPVEDLGSNLGVCLRVTDFGNSADFAELSERLADVKLECAQYLKDTSTEFLGPGITCPNTRTPLEPDCDETEMEANKLQFAIDILLVFIEENPDHQHIELAEMLLADIYIQQAELFNAGQIPQPGIQGINDSDLATITIQNASPQMLRLAFSGNTSLVDTVEECATCVTFSGGGPEDCPKEGPTRSFEVEPGMYSVVVTAIMIDQVTPFVGTWQLEAGTEYYSCFFLVRG